MIASLSGVRAVRPASGPLNLILQGREVGTRSNATEIAFAGAAGSGRDWAAFVARFAGPAARFAVVVANLVQPFPGASRWRTSSRVESRASLCL